jgi:hypothetical protein
MEINLNYLYTLMLISLMILTGCDFEKYQIVNLKPIGNQPFVLDVELLPNRIPALSINMQSKSDIPIEVDWKNVQLQYDQMSWSLPFNLYAPTNPIQVFYPQGRVEYHFTAEHIYLIENKYLNFRNFYQRNEFFSKINPQQKVKLFIPYRAYGKTNEAWSVAAWDFNISTDRSNHSNLPTWKEPFYVKHQKLFGINLGIGPQFLPEAIFKNGFHWDISAEYWMTSYFGLALQYKSISSSFSRGIDNEVFDLEYSNKLFGLNAFTSIKFFERLNIEPSLGVHLGSKEYQLIQPTGVIGDYKKELHEATEVILSGALRLRFLLSDQLFFYIVPEYYQSVAALDSKVSSVNTKSSQNVTITDGTSSYSNFLLSFKIGYHF